MIERVLLDSQEKVLSFFNENKNKSVLFTGRLAHTEMDERCIYRGRLIGLKQESEYSMFYFVILPDEYDKGGIKILSEHLKKYNIDKEYAFERIQLYYSVLIENKYYFIKVKRENGKCKKYGNKKV